MCGRYVSKEQASLERHWSLVRGGGDGAAFYAVVEAAGLEGIVAKREDAPYRAGRTSAWRKVKTPAFKAIEAKRLERSKRS